MGIVGTALAPLAGRGWRVLHDRRTPSGNMDLVAVGPPGIAIVAERHWSHPVTVTHDRRLAYSKYDVTSDLVDLAAQVEFVRSLIAVEGRRVAVHGYLVLTGSADRGREASDVGGVGVVGVERLSNVLSMGRIDLDRDLVDAVAETVAALLPSSTAPVDDSSTGEEVPSALFEKAHRFYYLSAPWRKGGNNRVYLNDRHGTTLGWTDLTTGAVEIDCGPDDEPFAKTLLAAADPGGIKVALGEVPKVPTRLFGGRLLSRIARLHTSLLVGQEWRNFGKHRLYGTLIDPSIDDFDLGWIDLKTGDLHPSGDGPLHRDRREPVHYLRYLEHHYPRRG